MENKNDEQDANLENSEEQEDNQEAGKAEDDDNQDKPEKTDREKELEAELGKARRLLNKAKKTKNEPDKSPDLKESDNRIDFGELAFYNSKDGVVKIDNDDDVEFLKETLADTSKSQKELLDKRWFQEELKDRKQARAKSDATPKGTKRSAGAEGDDVSVLRIKVESGDIKLSEIKDVKTRRAVSNAMIDKVSTGSKFYNS